MANDTAGGCCTQIKGLTRLTFFDGGQVAIVGLDEILAAAYGEGREATMATAREILRRVEAKNYIAPGDREEYPDLLLKEYHRFIARKEGKNMEMTP